MDVTPEVVAKKGISIPIGNEVGDNDWWRPTGRTFPGNIPEAVIDEVPWGEFTIRKLGGD